VRPTSERIIWSTYKGWFSRIGLQFCWSTGKVFDGKWEPEFLEQRSFYGKRDTAHATRDEATRSLKNDERVCWVLQKFYGYPSYKRGKQRRSDLQVQETFVLKHYVRRKGLRLEPPFLGQLCKRFDRSVPIEGQGACLGTSWGVSTRLQLVL
jgi:hypothetical protein